MTERLTVRGVEPRLLTVPLRRALHTSASRITDAVLGRGRCRPLPQRPKP
jgi:hypothetical protein